MTKTGPNEAFWRSPLLGRNDVIPLKGGPLEYFESGTGPTLVFVHGWLANANIWRNTIAELGDSFHCLVLDLPVGGHRHPLEPQADRTPDGIAALIADFLEHKDLRDVTLIGNDSGGAYAQIAIARHTNRVARLVLTSSETLYDQWPPQQFEFLTHLAGDPEALEQAIEGLRDEEALTDAYSADSGLTKRTPPVGVLQSYALPTAEDNRIRDDVAEVIASTTSEALHSASRELLTRTEFPILLAWSVEDPVFPLAHAEKFAAELPNAQLTTFEDSYSFTPEDRYDAIATAVRNFVPSGVTP